jgi:hypothetical protein
MDAHAAAWREKLPELAKAIDSGVFDANHLNNSKVGNFLFFF